MADSPQEFDFIRYLRSKQSVDDRALNQPTLKAFGHGMRAIQDAGNCRVVEFGAGVGAMFLRLLQEGIIYSGAYALVDNQLENITYAQEHVPAQLRQLGFQVAMGQDARGIHISHERGEIHLQMMLGDVYSFSEDLLQKYDAVVAHHLLDLLNLDIALPKLFDNLRPDGLFYFTLNYDGGTIFEPVVDEDLDQYIIAQYDRTMDERITDGRASGDSKTGRRLFSALPLYGGQILESGGSDWVVFPGASGYSHDEDYFLSFVLSSFEATMTNYPGVDQQKLMEWLQLRRKQLQDQELIFMVHQLDFFGRRQG